MMNMKLNPATKIVGAVMIAGLVYMVLNHFNMIPAALTMKSAVPTQVALSNDVDTSTVQTKAVEAVPLPATTPAKVGGPEVRINIWAWNAQMGLLFANGGPVTTAGSLMEKAGARVKINRQEDTEVSKQEQIKFAQALANGDSNPSTGPHFVIIMGDGAAQYLAAVKKATSKLGPEFGPEIVGAVGYSRGEDTFMGPQEWKDNPEAVKGQLVAGVLRDGDWNLAQYWLAQNGIKNNPDEHTIDPDALNWVAADSVNKATEMFIAGYCEDRGVVKEGKKTGEKVNACVKGLVTWTPGDVNAAKKRGGVVRILSTKENPYQMPAVLIGIKKWNADHAQQVEKLLTGTFAGADQVRSYPAALQRAGQAAYAVYAEESPSYWVKYFKGVQNERDKTGQPVSLGGSAVANLGDNLVLFGLAEGSGGDASLWKATYEGFGNIAKQQYPSLLPEFPKASEITNTKYLQNLQSKLAPSEAETQHFDESAEPIEGNAVVAKRNWSIQFDTGKATFTPQAQQTLEELYNQLVVGAALQVEVDGHTDNVGDPAKNKVLSEQRAFAVKQYLESKSSTLFPANRLSVRAFGDTSPIANNATPDGRAKNRRVTIILGTK
jgi:OOP family OmpA-OmpF porin